MYCQKMDLIEITLKVILKGLKGPKRVKFGGFDTFCQFSKSILITFLYFLYTRFLGMLLINCEEMDFIELFKRSFSRSERSGLAHFPIIIDIIQ